MNTTDTAGTGFSDPVSPPLLLVGEASQIPMGDRILRAAGWTASAVVIMLVILTFAFLFRESVDILEEVGFLRLLTDGAWNPLSSRFFLLPMLIGSAGVSFFAIAASALVGIPAALYCNFAAPAWAAAIVRGAASVLAGLPSVVFGLWGLVVLVPAVNRLHPPGASLLSGGLILAVMILPTVLLTADAALQGVPREVFEAATGLGLGRSSVIFRVMLPAAWGGIGAGVISGLARALGETMAVLMVCGNVPRLPRSLFDPIRTLTGNIALEMPYATGAHRSSLFLSGLVLLCASPFFLGVAGWIRRGRER